MKENEICPFCEMESGQGVVLPPNLQPKAFTMKRNPLLINRSAVLVTPDIAPIANGHLLIIPKTHSFSLLTQPSSVYAQMEEVMQHIQQFNQTTLGLKTIFFEHGTCMDHGSSCIGHCHIHAIPVTDLLYDTIVNEVYRKCGEPEPITSSENYLMFGRDANHLDFWEDKGISQWFRRLISEILDTPARSEWRNCLIDEAELQLTVRYLEESQLRYALLN